MLGLLGLLLSIATYLWTRQRSILAFTKLSLPLLGSRDRALPDEVEVLFAGKRVPRVTKLTLVFWNAGEKTIPGTDLVKADPLRIEFDSEIQILSSKIVRFTRPVNFVALSDKSSLYNACVITYDFLDRNDGFCLEILHTGGPNDGVLRGTVIGIPGGPICKGPIDHFRGNRWELWTCIFSMCWLTYFSVVGISRSSSWFAILVFTLFIIICITLGSYILRQLASSSPKSLRLDK
jgi:hypothetical protein